MENFTVKQELLPNRCDICHQNDRFIPADNYCYRCIDVKISINKIKSNQNVINSSPLIGDGLKYSSIITFTFISLLF